LRASTHSFRLFFCPLLFFSPKKRWSGAFLPFSIAPMQMETLPPSFWFPFLTFSKFLFFSDVLVMGVPPPSVHRVGLSTFFFFFGFDTIGSAEVCEEPPPDSYPPLTPPSPAFPFSKPAQEILIPILDVPLLPGSAPLFELLKLPVKFPDVPPQAVRLFLRRLPAFFFFL